MTYDTLVSVEQLLALQRSGTPVSIFDCSFELANPHAGRQAFAAGHIPGAQYMDLERDLSAPRTGSNGRHPLPALESFANTLISAGVTDVTQVVAYDDAGAMYAARLWWMLRWAGHRRVAVLDGGIAAWRAAGHPLAVGSSEQVAPGQFSRRPSLVTSLSYQQMQVNLVRGDRLVLDARAPDRFRGENETMDPIGGHIPGARNRLFRENLDAQGRFKSANCLRREFDAITGNRPGTALVSQCGSGVTACHNLLAMEIAGLSGAALYPGSWSEWVAQPGAPVATGV